MHPGRLITVRGVVKRASPIRQLILSMEFACTRCSSRQRCTFPEGTAARPTVCGDGCRSKSFAPLPDTAKTIPWQRIRLQVQNSPHLLHCSFYTLLQGVLLPDRDLYDSMCFCTARHFTGKACDAALQGLRPLGSPAGAERMSTVEIELRGSLAGSCTPGDTITCVGLVKVLKTESSSGRHLPMNAAAVWRMSTSASNDVMVPCPQLLPLSHLTWSMCSTKAGELGDCKKALFLLYIGANSISMGADISRYLPPDSRWGFRDDHQFALQQSDMQPKS